MSLRTITRLSFYYCLTPALSLHLHIPFSDGWRPQAWSFSRRHAISKVIEMVRLHLKGHQDGTIRFFLRRRIENRCGDNLALPPNQEVVTSDIIWTHPWLRFQTTLTTCSSMRLSFLRYIWYKERKMRHPVMVSPLMTCHSEQ